jgi:hypothetical protein
VLDLAISYDEDPDRVAGFRLAHADLKVRATI